MKFLRVFKPMVIPIKITGFHIDARTTMKVVTIEAGKIHPGSNKTYARNTKYKFPIIVHDITVEIESENIFVGNVVMLNTGLKLMAISVFNGKSVKLKNLSTEAGQAFDFDSTASTAVILSSAAPEV